MAGEPGAAVQHGGQSELGVGTDAGFLVRRTVLLRLLRVDGVDVSSDEMQAGRTCHFNVARALRNLWWVVVELFFALC